MASYAHGWPANLSKFAVKDWNHSIFHHPPWCWCWGKTYAQSCHGAQKGSIFIWRCSTVLRRCRFVKLDSNEILAATVFTLKISSFEVKGLRKKWPIFWMLVNSGIWFSVKTPSQTVKSTKNTQVVSKFTRILPISDTCPPSVRMRNGDKKTSELFWP